MNRTSMLACIISCVLLINLIFTNGSMCHESGTVVINELLINPSAVSDSKGEWIELYNTSSLVIDLNGWKVTDNRNDTFFIDSSLEIGPGCYIVLARCDDFSVNGGVESDYSYKGMYLSNGTDTVSLYDEKDVLIDSVTYGVDGGFPLIAGASMELIHPSYDHAVADSWIPSICVFGDGDRGTPGYQNSCFEVPKKEHVNLPPYYAIMKVFSYRANCLLNAIENMPEKKILHAGLLPDIKNSMDKGDILRALVALENAARLSLV